MNDKEDTLHSDDQEPKVIEQHDPKIEERKPPNDKIIKYKIVESDENSDS